MLNFFYLLKLHLNPTLKKVLKFFIISALLVLFLWLSLRSVDFHDFVDKLSKVNYFLAIAGGIVGVVIGSYLRALRWRYFLNPIKPNIGIKNLFSTVMIGYMSNLVFPRAGEVSRPFILAKNENISKGAAFGTILVERIFDVLSVLVAFGICLFFYKDKLSHVLPEYNIETIALILSILVFSAVIFILIVIFNLEKSEKIIGIITVKILPKKIQAKIQGGLVSVINGFLFIKYPRQYLPIFIYSVGIIFMYVLSTYITFFACNIDNLTLMDANLVLAMITLPMFLPLPGNSAGAFHYVCTGTLVNMFGIDREVAFSYATINHLVGLLLQVIIGAYYFFRENYKVKDIKETARIETTKK